MSDETNPPEADAEAAEPGPEPKRGRGQPTKLTPAVADKVVEGLKVGLSPELASERAGITRRTYARWKAKGERDDEADVDSDERDFCHRIAGARAEFAYDACDWLKKARDIPSKETNAPTVTFMLERRYREDYGRSESVELTGKGGGPVQVQTLEDAIALSNGAGAASPDDEPGA